MAENTVKVGLVVSDDGTAAKTTKNVENLKDVVVQTEAAVKRTSKALSAMNAPGSATIASAKAASQTYGVSRGTIGTGAEGRDFAKQSQGLGGLVRLYATFAANIFAATAAFRALSTAMDTTNMVRGLDQLGAQSGMALGSLAKDLVRASDGAVSLRESMDAVAKGTAAGLSSQQMLRLGEAAKKTSQALGIAMPDALSRLSRGISKIEPELLDELGIYVKIEDASKKYALALGKPISALTEFERRQGFANAVLEQAEKKFSNIEIDANPYAKLAASLANLAQSGLELANKVLGPIVKLLSESPVALAAVIGLIGKSLINQAIPALGAWRSKLSEAAEAARQNEIATANARKSLRSYIDVKAAEKIIDTESIARKRVETALLNTQAAAASKFTPTTKKILAAQPTGTLSKEALTALDAQAKKIEADYTRQNTLSDQLIAKKKAEVAAIREITAATRELQAAEAAKQKLEQYKFPVGYKAKEALDARAAAAAAKKSAVIGILSEVSEAGKLSGPGAAWEKYSEQITKAGKAAEAGGPKLGMLSKGFLLAGTAAISMGSAIEIAMSVLNRVFAVIAILVTVFQILDAVFSKNEKSAAEASQAFDTLAESGRNIDRVIDTISKKDPLEKFSTESIMARATAFNDLSTNMVSSLDKAKKAIADMGWFDVGVDLVKGIFNQDVASKQTKLFADSITKSLKIVPEGAEKERLKSQLYKTLGVDPTSKEAIINLNPTFDTQAKATQQLQELSRVISETAGKAQQLDESFKNTSKTLDTILVSAIPTDPLAKLGSDMLALGKDMTLALKDPATALDQLQKISGDISKLRFFSPESADAFLKQSEDIKQTVSQIAIFKNSIEELVQKQAKLKEEMAGSFTSYSKLPEFNQNAESIQIIKQQQAAAEASLVGAQERLNRETLTIFAKGSKYIQDSIGLGFAKAALTVQGALLSGLGDTLGGIQARADLQKQQIDLDSAQLKITASLIDSQERLRLAQEEQTRTIKEQEITGGRSTLSADAQSAELKRIAAERAAIERLRGASTETLASTIKAGGTRTSTAQNMPTADKVESLAAANIAAAQLSVEFAKQGVSAQLAQKSAEKQAVDLQTAFQIIEKTSQLKKAELQSDLDILNTEKTLLDIQNSSSEFLSEQAISKRTSLNYDILANKQAQENLDLQSKIAKATFVQADVRSTTKQKEAAKTSLEEYAVASAQLTNKQAGETAVATAQDLQAKIANDKKRLELELAADKLIFDTRIAQENSVLNRKQENLNTLKALDILSPERVIAEQTSIDIAQEKIRSQIEVNRLQDESFTKLTELNVQLSNTNIADTDRVEYLKEQIASQTAFYQGSLSGEMMLSAAKVQNLGIISAQNIELEKQRQKQADINSLTTSLTALFGELGTALGGVVASITAAADADTKYLNDKKILQDKIDKAAPGDAKTALIEEQGKAEKKNAKAQLDNNIKILNSSKKIFSEKTVAYKVLDAAEKAMHIQKTIRAAIELSTEIKAFAVRIGLISAETTADVTGAVASTAAKTPEAVANIWSKVDPITAVGLTAAFLALMASLGAGSGGGSGVSVSQQRQETQARGSVLGDETAQSNSVRNSLEIIAATTVEDLSFSNRMVTLLQSIDQGIRGVTKGLYNVRGLRGEVSAFGTVEGKTNKVNIPVIGGLFGSTTKTITDTGIIITGFFDDLVKGTTGFLQQFEEVTTKKKRLFGGTRTRVKTNITDIDEEKAAGLVDIFENANELILEVGQKLGMQEQSILNTLKQLKIDTGKFSLKGLSGQALEDALTALVNDVLDTAAGAVFSVFEKYQQMGEGLLETVIRVVDSNDKINLALTSIGKSTIGVGAALSGFAGNLQMASFDISEALVDAAGGLQNFLDQARSFRDNFLTEAEQMAPIREAVGTEISRLLEDVTTTTTKTISGGFLRPDQTETTTTTNISELNNLMRRLGISVLDTKDEFKLLVQNVDLTTESGRELYQQLMNVAPTFAKLEDYEKKLADARLDQQERILELSITNKSEIAKLALSRRRELEQLDDLLKPTQLYIYALEDEATIREKLIKARDQETAALEKTIGALKTSIQTLKDYKASLLAGSMSTLTPEQKYTQAKQAALELSAIAQGPAGTAAEIAARDAALAKLPAATNAFLEASRVSFASGAQYTADFNTVLSILDSTSSALSLQQTDAEKQLSELKTSTAFLDVIAQSTSTVAELLPKYLAAVATTGVLAANADAGTMPATVNGVPPVAAATPGSPTAVNQELATTIVDLRNEISGLKTEISTLRTEQQAQTTQTVVANYDANNINAQQISENLAKFWLNADFYRRNAVSIR